ncbi:hypothetical protein CFP56_001126 [Quercus suber]|uniref:F-box domain-containing protein n=1 Tax=Quercus suber TaxID=58331 RepID=A0AAW0INM7_QUESU
MAKRKGRNTILMTNKVLPEDLVIQILLWWPAMSLLRFKGVCKSWYVIISGQNFINKQLLHSQTTFPMDVPLKTQQTNNIVQRKTVKKKKIKPSKRKQAGIDEIGGIEDDEGGIGDDVEVDGDRASEVAGDEVWFEETRLPFELLHRLKQKQR